MTTEKNYKFSVITNPSKTIEENDINSKPVGFQTNVLYEKLLTFNELQNKQKKRFSVDDLFKLC